MAFGETAVLVKGIDATWFNVQFILSLSSVVSPHHSSAAAAAVWQKTFDPPILWGNMALFLCPGAFLVHAEERWLQAPCV